MPSSSTASADLHSSGQAHSADMGSNSAGSCLMAATEQLRLFGPLGPDSRFSPPAMLPQPLPQAMHPALMPPDHHDIGLMQQFASCSFRGEHSPGAPAHMRGLTPAVLPAHLQLHAALVCITRKAGVYKENMAYACRRGPGARAAPERAPACGTTSRRPDPATLAPCAALRLRVVRVRPRAGRACRLAYAACRAARGRRSGAQLHAGMDIFYCVE